MKKLYVIIILGILGAIALDKVIVPWIQEVLCNTILICS